jgi:hypothetical protein
MNGADGNGQAAGSGGDGPQAIGGPGAIGPLGHGAPMSPREPDEGPRGGSR